MVGEHKVCAAAPFPSLGAIPALASTKTSKHRHHEVDGCKGTKKSHHPSTTAPWHAKQPAASAPLHMQQLVVAPRPLPMLQKHQLP